MYNAFRAAYEPALPVLTASISTELKRPDDYRALADAISAGDAAKAKKAAQDLIERANATLTAAFDKAGSRQ